MQRRIERAHGARLAFHHAEYFKEVVALVRQDFCQGGAPAIDSFGENHLAHCVDAVAAEEHVFGAAQPDALRAERDCVPALVRLVGVCADAQVRTPSAHFINRL